MRTFWTNTDDKFILENRDVRTLLELAKTLGRTKSSVNNRLRLLDGRRVTSKALPRRRIRRTSIVPHVAKAPSFVPGNGSIPFTRPFIVTVPDVVAKTFGGLYGALRVLYSTPVPGSRVEFSTPATLVEAARHAAAKQRVDVVVVDESTNLVGDVINGTVRNLRFIVLVKSFLA